MPPMSWSSCADGPEAAIGIPFASDVMAGQRKARTITETAVASTMAIAMTRAHGVGPADGVWSDMASLPGLQNECSFFIMDPRGRLVKTSSSRPHQ